MTLATIRCLLPGSKKREIRREPSYGGVEVEYFFSSSM